MIRPCDSRDFDTTYAIVNDAAMAYKGIIPAGRYRTSMRIAERTPEPVAADVPP